LKRNAGFVETGEEFKETKFVIKKGKQGLTTTSDFGQGSYRTN
jgi:hypothetical protein